jgi:HAD superfamily hydrolase (TIGR01509 family)
MLKAVLFDMDGVIIDSEPLHKKAYQAMFNQIGIKVSPDMYQSFTGQSTISICRFLCQEFNLPETPETLMKSKRAFFKHLFANDPDLHLIDGVLDLIQDYQRNGLTLVLASSASMTTINNVFTRFDLDQYFQAKLSGADLKASKPHPEIFINAAAASGHHRSECFVIEDSTNGIKAAKAANVYCVAFKSPHSLNQVYDLADLVIEDFEDITYAKVSKLL